MTKFGETYEVRIDDSAYSRYLLGATLFLVSIVSGLIFLLLAAIVTKLGFSLHIESALLKRTLLVVFVTWQFVVPALAFAYFIFSAYYYWCPSCHKKLIRVSDGTRRICFSCADCKLIWDLGWTFGDSAGGGGG